MQESWAHKHGVDADINWVQKMGTEMDIEMDTENGYRKLVQKMDTENRTQNNS